MIEKKGWLKNAEARLNGFYIKGNKVKGCTLTQAEVDAWNGTAKKAAPAPEPVVEEVVVEEEVVVTDEPAPAPTTKSKKKKGGLTLKGIAKAAVGK